MSPCCLHERVGQRLETFSVLFIGLGLKLLNSLPYFDCSGGGWQWRAVADGDGLQCPFGNLPNVASTFEAEDAAPQAVEVNGNDRRIHAFHDALEAAPEGKQLSDPRHLPFRKDADNLPVADRVARRAKR